MNYFITGGTGFIGTHLTNLLNETHPECNVYNLDIVEPGTPLPTVKDYKPALKKGQKLGSTFVRCDVRKPIELPASIHPTSEDVIFNFAAVHRTPGHPNYEYFETNIRGAEHICCVCRTLWYQENRYSLRLLLPMGQRRRRSLSPHYLHRILPMASRNW